MKRRFSILLTTVLALAVAAPAMAQFSLGGYYRVTGVSQNIKSKSDEPVTETLIDQRIRMKLTNTFNDYVKFVYYMEVDTPWGMQSKGKIGGGGEVGTDGVNVETKNAYIDVKVPGTTISARVGLHGIDDLFQYVVISEDVAAALVSAEVAGADLELIYSKFYEGGKSTWDDDDFYGVHLKKKFAGQGRELRAGAAIYYQDNNDPAGGSDVSETFWYGLVGDYRVGKLGIEAFAVLQDGTEGEGAAEVDSTALVASARAAMVVPHGQVGLRGIYFSPDDDATDHNAWRSGVGEWEFPRENMMIFLPDRWVNNSGTTRYAIADAATEGFGLYALTATAFLKDLPFGTYANLGAGGFWAADERNDAGGSHVSGTLVDGSSDVRAGSTLGYEVTAQVGKVIAEKVDLSLRGAYAVFGDFYDDTVATAGGVTDPDDVYKVALMINVGF